MRQRLAALAISMSAAMMLTLPACSTKGAGTGDGARAEESAARISAGMSRLGASRDRSECIAGRIASSLDGKDANEAVRIVETSNTKEEMRSGVLRASTPVKQSFIRANFGCSFYQ